MTAPGKRDNRVTIERSTVTQDEYNEDIEAWAPIGARWTAIHYGIGQERREAAMKQGSQAASFVMLADSLTKTVTIKDRLVFGGSNWDIIGISPIVRSEIEFSAVAAR